MATENAFLDKFGVTVLWNSLKNYINKVMPKKLSAFSNDEGYIKGISTLTFTGAQEATFDGKHNVTINIPNSSGEVTPGVTNYNDLTNKPSINGILLSGNKTLSNLGINIPTRVSQLSNDADYLTSSSLTGYVKRTDLTNVAFTGSYNSLTNKPTIPVLPSNVSAFYNDAGYLTTHQDISGKVDYSELNNRLSNIYTKAQVDALIDEIQTEGGGEVDLRNYYTKDAADGRFQPIGNYLTSHQDISGKANTVDLKAVAFSGNYSDLVGKPTILQPGASTDDIEYSEGQGQTMYFQDGVTLTDALQSLDAAVSTKATDNLVVHKGGSETITGSKKFQGVYDSININLFNSDNSNITWIDEYSGEAYYREPFAWIQANDGVNTTTLQQALDAKEVTSHKITSISSSSTNTQYPSALAVYNALSTKQNTLVSGETIKTINGNSILGSGNITIQGGSGGKIYYYSNDDYNVVYDGDAAITSFDGFLTESIYNAVFQNYSGGLVYRLSRVKYYEGYEAALNKINQLVFTGYLFNSDGILKKDFYISRTYENDPYDYSVVSIDTSIASFNATTQTLDIETTSSSTIPVPAEEAQERWVDNGTICVGYNKHVKQKKQISNDGGITWSDTSETRTGSLIEANSTDCGYSPGGGDTDDYANQYLTIESLDDDNTVSFKAESITKTIYFSVDNGVTWAAVTASTEGANIATLNNGQKLLLKGDNGYYGNANSYDRIQTDKRFNVYGNIMSLISSTSFSSLTSFTSEYVFKGLFRLCSGLISAENLVLPAMTLTYGCYAEMFRGCSSLTKTPQLPATTLAGGCYNGMFWGCTGLSEASALPATVLKSDCYANMFAECSYLIAAPELPAETLVQNCYYAMFRQCYRLNYIKAMFTTTPGTTYTNGWLTAVSSTGTFVKNSAATWDVTGSAGIPTGWTIQTASA